MSNAPAPRPELPELSPGAATWRGAVTALVVALPAGLLNQYLIDSEEISSGSPIVLLFYLLILLGGAAGGWAVIRLAPSARLSHAAAAGAIAYVVVQLIGVTRRLVSGDTISWLAFPLLCALMATCGMLGGMFAHHWMSQNESSGNGGRT